MKIFGYSSEYSSEVLKMDEITIQSDIATLRNLASFFRRCAEEMEADVEWEHAHFSEFLDSDIQKSETDDIIVFRN